MVARGTDSAGGAGGVGIEGSGADGALGLGGAGSDSFNAASGAGGGGWYGGGGGASGESFDQPRGLLRRGRWRRFQPGRRGDEQRRDAGRAGRRRAVGDDQLRDSCRAEPIANTDRDSYTDGV